MIKEERTLVGKGREWKQPDWVCVSVEEAQEVLAAQGQDPNFEAWLRGNLHTNMHWEDFGLEEKRKILVAKAVKKMETQDLLVRYWRAFLELETSLIEMWAVESELGKVQEFMDLAAPKGSIRKE